VWFKCMHPVKICMTMQEFHQLPRHPAYKYEYIDGQTWLTPRPRTYHALLDLRPSEANTEGGDITTRPITETDWVDLTRLFSAAFRDRPPFLGLSDRKRRAAARAILNHARAGRDGPFIAQASYIAHGKHHDGPTGGIVVTLLPDSDPADWHAFEWSEPPPPDAIARGLGRPHLTWVFVHPLASDQGVGTALLRAATRELLALGFNQLASTFLLGNESSTLWHWRNGFRLLASAWSRQRR
jgi:GNAT superfamily N-acetyltransferase